METAQPTPAELATERFTVGVEEEYQIVNPETRALRPGGGPVLDRAHETAGDEVQPEFRLSQIETATEVCCTLSEIRAELVRLRRTVIEAAVREGSRIAAAATHPFSHSEEQPFTPKERYWKMAVDYQYLARELLICGCHVHVGMESPEAALEVMNRARIWLTPLLALSASSPFWIGEDTGYASYRTELWTRWPMAGQPQLFSSRQEYRELLDALVQTEVIEDTTRIYWDIRLPERLPTVEFRVADVCLTIDEAVMIAGLARALARTCFEQAQADAPYCRARPELLRAAHWRAARYSLYGELIDVQQCRSVPAVELVDSFLSFVRPALEAQGDWEEVSALVGRTLEHGNGAARQRDVYQRTGRLEDVVDYVIRETEKDTGVSV